MLRLLSILAIAITWAHIALAAPTLVLQSKDWQVFKTEANGKTICYATTEAYDKQPSSARHGRVFFFVSNWKGGIKNQPSAIVGYDFKSNATPKVSIDGKSWSLFPSGNEAFAMDQDDSSIVSAAKLGNSLRLSGVSARGTQVAYNFSLSGSSRAITRAMETCI